MAQLREICRYTDQLLEAGSFKDYCPNGLQLEGKAEVKKIVSGVTASADLIDQAIAQGADLLLVHHGWFWKNEPSPIIGMRKRRIAKMLQSDISLLAYHLPLDAHPQLGNNVQLGQLLDIDFQPAQNQMLVTQGELPQAMSAEQLAQHLELKLGRAPLHFGHGPKQIKRVAWCTGGAQSYIQTALDMGVDAYITGEVSEATFHIAREAGIHFFAAGHHATERGGVKALGDHLAENFSIEHQFIDLINPV
ncbi:Nif3-like dinuclear metal center hexameric protein [Pelagibaculum spongiae]|uniref:GTP cyclohydrolase 1 type 2 homolog n=1 Tax=Pelagibaculum spongiae TaxID=2080658 RepID=A0A2V1H3Z1_9GAMM|nr:Nif3-like dinuclear metal center hexameric protein [Pelagibaculum spongiae]PVZ71907.1 Nif3-like dinuclear metal center hexameric protein [Pelagibaculum spongiae]